MVGHRAQPRLKGTILEGHDPGAPEVSILVGSRAILESQSNATSYQRTGQGLINAVVSMGRCNTKLEPALH
jgi:hypothetical protein